jgi:hypothetical protein
MPTTSKRVLFWIPRILCLVFAAFISSFALHVFDERLGVSNTPLALLMHLIPTFLILACAGGFMAREWVGAVLFTALAPLYLILFWGRFHWSAYAAISGPLSLVGGLFLLNRL